MSAEQIAFEAHARPWRTALRWIKRAALTLLIFVLICYGAAATLLVGELDRVISGFQVTCQATRNGSHLICQYTATREVFVIRKPAVEPL